MSVTTLVFHFEMCPYIASAVIGLSHHAPKAVPMVESVNGRIGIARRVNGDSSLSSAKNSRGSGFLLWLVVPVARIGLICWLVVAPTQIVPGTKRNNFASKKSHLR